MQMLEDANRGLEDEVAELRELQDRAGESAEARALEREIRVCREHHRHNSFAAMHAQPLLVYRSCGSCMRRRGKPVTA